MKKNAGATLDTASASRRNWIDPSGTDYGFESGQTCYKANILEARGEEIRLQMDALGLTEEEVERQFEEWRARRRTNSR